MSRSARGPNLRPVIRRGTRVVVRLTREHGRVTDVVQWDHEEFKVLLDNHWSKSFYFSRRELRREDA